MVKSKINDSVDYVESKKIQKEDYDLECTSVYSIEFDEIDSGKYDVVFGNRNNSNLHKGIVYFPMYILQNSKVKNQIGCNEIKLTDIPNAVDEDGDIEPDYINPLLYKYVDKKYLHSIKEVEKKEKDDKDEHGKEEDKELQEEIDKNIDLGVISLDDEVEETDVFSVPVHKMSHIKEKLFEVDLNHKMPQSLSEETKIEAKEIRDKYSVAAHDNWLQKFMKNKDYDIINNEGNGDCFFAVVRDAYEQIGKKITVDKLRKIVSEEMTEPLYKETRKVYLEIESSMDETKNDIKKHTGYINEIRKRIKSINNISKLQHEELINDANISKQTIKQLRKELLQQELIMKDFTHMQKLDTLSKYQEYMNTPSFWADAWTISTLEYKLNIKFIIMSEESYTDDAEDSVMQCGDFNTHLQEKGVFAPEWYIMTTYDGNHYQLITYKKKRILEFKEIPYDIKNLILNKCLEKNAGPYNLIEDFRNLKKKVGANENDDDSVNTHSSLHDSDTVFMFHSKSERKSKPGKGSGEKIHSNKILSFKPLEKHTDWRRKLDDSFITEFKVDKYKWASVEHYYQASKFKNGFPDYYLQFTLDSESDISKDVTAAKKKGNQQGQDKKVKIDPDFYGQRSIEEREKAVKAKFEQNEELKNILIKTYPARLDKFTRGSKPSTDEIVMQVRKQLVNDK